MRCPQCGGSSLHGQAVRESVLVEVCSQCQGLWLDRGQIYEFTANPQALEKQLDHGLRQRQPSDRLCPRCECNLERGQLPDRDATVEQCPSCGGLWFQADELQKAVHAGQDRLDFQLARQTSEEETPETDPHAHARAHERMQGLAAGLLALPNLFLRSTLVLVLLYGLLSLVLITLVQFSVLGPAVALGIGVAIALLQFTLGPWIMDLMLRWLYDFRWVKPDELPEHLQAFVQRVCDQHRMRFPSFGLIHDGAPAAFTYGHHPSNARVVISRGLLQLLEADEVEAVVAHELGHARNWDMALMTLANLVPLLLYYLYRVAMDHAGSKGDKKDGGWTWAVGIGAYVLYVISEYIVLWFSRTREYYADRFSGRVTGKPNALSSALVKIAYGLAAAGQPVEAEKEEKGEKGEKGEKKKQHGSRVEALGALNIFDRSAAVGLVMASSSGKESDPRRPDVEQVKSAMQWDMWNPWAKYYELHSTHPLVAKRLLYLSDQAAQQGQEPLVVFDRRKPESYWDSFFVDLFMMLLPWLCFLGAAGLSFAFTTSLDWWKALCVAFGAGLALAGLGSLFKTRFVYRRDFFPHLSVAALLHKVKVSGVRPVPTTLTGTIIGKGVPGLIWSENFVMQDRTGILFLEYNQPLALWNFLFGLLKAGEYQGKQVRVSGWFRRAPVPYLEINSVETLDGSLPTRNCYASTARRACGLLMVVIGAIITAGVLLMK
jgi:Zn-dependent protease with chaperone function/Zn-finger nucleic acid-binding protein